MVDVDKTKEQLIDELEKMCRQRITELKAPETERKQAEGALRESEQKYHSLFDNMLDGLAYCKILVDENNQPIDFVHLEVNDAWERLIGLKKEDVIGEKITEVIPGIKEAKTDLISIYGKVALTGEEAKFDLYFEPLEKWFNISVYSPQKGYFVTVFENITERKQAEEELRESEERYRALVNLGGSVGEAIIMVQDKDGVDAVQTFVSDEWPRITGYFRKELLGMSFYDLLHPRYSEASLKRHKKKISGEIMPGLFEMSIVRKDGTEVPIELTSAYTTYKGERANVAFIRDITERKRAEEEVEAKAQLLDIATDSILLHDIGGKITYVNATACRNYGYSKDEFLEMNIRDIRVSQDAIPLEWRINEVMRKGETIFESAHLRKNKSVIPIEVHSRVIESGDTKHVLSVIRDISERKQAEEREKELQQELNLSSRLASVGELAAGVAHEINNPLTGIMGFSERLLRKSIDEEVRRDLERIHSEAERAAKIVESLRTFARRREPKKEYLDINEILARTLELRAYELRTGNIELAVELAPDIPETIGDFGQIQQVFLNIILNAEQAITEANGGGKLTIKTQEVYGCIRVSFTDNGPGIPAEHLDKLFDPFFTTRGEKGGTGLGLSACHGIVTEHGGRIYAKSKPGKGATFSVELPATAKETGK